AGSAVYALMARDFAPKAQRLRWATARMRYIPALFAAARANLKTPARELTEVAIVMARGGAAFFSGPAVAWAPAAAGGHAALLADFTAVDEATVAASRDFAEWLESDLLGRSTGSFALGEQLLRAKLHDEEMVDTPLAELLATGEKQLARDHAALVTLAAAIDPTRSAAEVVKIVAADHPTADDLIPAVARSLEDVRRFIVEKDLITIPSQVRPLVEPTPSFARGFGFTFMSTPGPFETKATEAYYYVEPVEKDWDARHQEEHLRLFNLPVIVLRDIHEAYPGHYVQFLYMASVPTTVRKLAVAATNVEGWAHYAEQMVIDEGYHGGDPRLRLGQLTEALVRDCRFVAAINLHARGMTIPEAQTPFPEPAFMEPANAAMEARRGAVDP